VKRTNIWLNFLFGLLGFLGVILLLVIFFVAGKLIKAFLNWRRGVHE